MKLSRRGMIASAAAVPIAAAGLSAWQYSRQGGTVVLYDPALPQARTFAEVERGQNRPAFAMEGDRIRFAREVLDRRPQILRGLSRQSDAVLVGEVAEEAGYELIARRVDGALIDWTYAPRVRG